MEGTQIGKHRVVRWGCHVPALKAKEPDTGEVVGEVTNNVEKASMFYKLFFPPKPAAALTPAGVTFPQ